MRVSIILPPAGSQPVGGYAVQYCFADQLALIGDVPTIVHPLRLGRPSRTELRGEACSFARATRRGGRLIPWHKFDRGVKLRFVPWLAPAFLPRADVTVLTAYETAAAHGPRTRRSGPLVQVVFDYEFWVEGDAATREAISAALSRPDVTHIAGSSAVREMLESMGVTPVATIPPGIIPTVSTAARRRRSGPSRLGSLSAPPPTRAWAT